MKTITTLLFVMALTLSCSEEDNGPQKGCLYGITKLGDKVFMRCCTREEYLAGSNVAAGGTANWELYDDHEWKEVSSCSKCN